MHKKTTDIKLAALIAEGLAGLLWILPLIVVILTELFSSNPNLFYIFAIIVYGCLLSAVIVFLMFLSRKRPFLAGILLVPTGIIAVVLGAIFLISNYMVAFSETLFPIGFLFSVPLLALSAFLLIIESVRVFLKIAPAEKF